MWFLKLNSLFNGYVGPVPTAQRDIYGDNINNLNLVFMN